MNQESWPTPQSPARDPLPRVEDLPIADQGYEQESVRAAFDAFYRHAAQLDASLRTLEAVDSFHRHAAALRADLRSLRAAGWSQQPWTSPPTYAYGGGAEREGIPAAVWRVGFEALFLVAVAVGAAVAKLSWWVIVLVMAAAWAIVGLIEWLSARERFVPPRAAAAPTPHPVVEADTAERAEEQEALGWTAFEEAQEPSDAMTMIDAEAAERPVRESGPVEGVWGNRAVPPAGGENPEAAERPVRESGPVEGVRGNREAAQPPVRDSGPVEGVWGNREVPPAGGENREVPPAGGENREVPETSAEDTAEQPAAKPAPDPEPAQSPEPEPSAEPEPDLAPASEAGEEPRRRRRWRRKRGEEEPAAEPAPEPSPPRHVRVLPADGDPPPTDPWEQGFDAPQSRDEPAEVGEETEEPVVADEGSRRKFRRR